MKTRAKDKDGVKIPNGWRKLRRGTIIRVGDKLFFQSIREFLLSHNQGLRVGSFGCDFTYIRPLKPKGRKK